MKKFYICECCEKQYETEKEALSCEALHRVEEEQKAKNEKDKADRSKAISNLMNLYIQRYGEMPNIELSDENYRTVLGAILGSFNSLFQ